MIAGVLVFLQHALVHGRLTVAGKVINPVILLGDLGPVSRSVHFVHGKRRAAVHGKPPLAASADALKVLHVAESRQGIRQAQLCDNRLIDICGRVLGNQMIDDAAVFVRRNLCAHRLSHKRAVQIAFSFFQKGDIRVRVKCVLPVVVGIAVGLVPQSQRILCDLVDIRVFVGPVGPSGCFLPLEGGAARVAGENILGQTAGDIHRVCGCPRIVDHRVGNLCPKGNCHLVAVLQVVVRQRYDQILNSLAVVDHADLFRFYLRSIPADLNRTLIRVYAKRQPVDKYRAHHLASDRFPADVFQCHGVCQLVVHLDIAGSRVRRPRLVGHVQACGNGGDIRLQNRHICEYVFAQIIGLMRTVV